jgi:methylamine---glutamate N-methyltransferase subunit B
MASLNDRVATTVMCDDRPVRAINRQIRDLIAAGEREFVVSDPRGMHNLAVGILEPACVAILGSVGYYCGGLVDGLKLEVQGSAGWGLAESMLDGEVVVQGNAGNGAAAAIRGGTVVIHGDAASRLGVSMKGGTILVGGNCGYMAGFMGQKGRLIVCGDTGEAFADSLYSTVCYVGGKVAELGTDGVYAELEPAEAAELDELLDKYFSPSVRLTKPKGIDFKKIVAGRKLWNFDQSEWKIWQEAL